MKIVVISDTHMPNRAKQLPLRLNEELNQADLIIHCGDWQTVEVYEELVKFAKVCGVFGNVDLPEIKELLPEKQLLEIKGFKIGVTHGHGKKLTTEKRALAAFNGEDVDCIIFGHSHIPVNKTVDGVLLFNPGSPTDKRRQKEYSFGILTLTDQFQADHVFFPNKD